MQVFKFGGASVKDAESVRNVANILRKHCDRKTVVVISAMGKMTNALEEIVNLRLNSENRLSEATSNFFNFHNTILNELIPADGLVYSNFENLKSKFEQTLELPIVSANQTYDAIVCFGELLSTFIVSSYLNKIGINNKLVDARELIKTDSSFREANVNFQLSEDLIRHNLLDELDKNEIIITQGFIGSDANNNAVTLGREGSDYTASLIAYFINASKVVIWKDVPGVLNADPKYFKNTEIIKELSYHDAIEMTYFGASVIHPKTIKPLQNKSITLYVNSFLAPEKTGTAIGNTNSRLNIPTFIFKNNQILVSVQPKDFSFIAEKNLSTIFKIISDLNIKVNMMQNSALSFSICIDNNSERFSDLLEQLSEGYSVLYNENVKLMTIRNYNDDLISQLAKNHEILLEQRTRTTIQMVLNEVII
ncbi:MAG: aspartate kinase [Bacteroidia bacterium]